MKKNSKKILILSIVAIAIGIGLGFLFFNQDNQLSGSERKWISDNSKVVQNINVLNDTNLFGNLGQGLYYTFLEDFIDTYNLQINPVTIKKDEEIKGLSFSVGSVLPANSFSFYEDHYVILSHNEEVLTNYEGLNGKNVGVFSQDTNVIRNYFGTSTINYLSYNTMDELYNAFDNNQVSYIILPRIENIDAILKRKYWIGYHCSDLKRYFYVTDEKNTTLYNIIKKYYQTWQKKHLEEELYENERNLFQDALNITKASLAELQKNPIVYGYTNHAPYEIYGDSKFGGIVSVYLNAFSKFSDIEIKYNKYGSEKRLTKDINAGKVDLYFNFSSLVNTGANIKTLLPLTMDIYASEKNPIVIHSFETLKTMPIYVEEDTLLYQELKSINGLNVISYKSKDFPKVKKNKNNLIAIDHEAGLYFHNSNLKNYTSRFTYQLNTTYTMKSFGNDTLNSLLTKYLNYLDNHTYLRLGLYNSLETERNGSFVASLAKYALYTLLITAFILLIIYRSSKKVRMQKKIKKEDKIKFIDQLTSLKNRNYLNDNLANWNKNTVYPQSIIMINLDHLQDINDTLGYEEGDRQIRSTANALIKTQLDNSDIIRTDGNEFVIYLVGYSQKQITNYIHKLTKELKDLPFKEHGATIAYKMIENDLKSIEDAINECTLDIKKQKEMKREDAK